MYAYPAHIFKQRQVGSREEVKIKLFNQNGDPIDLCEITGSENSENPTNLTEHVNSETPHLVYDDGPSLILLYANAKV